jgi:formylglycine-generating enzyme required for sulfatase activity
MAYIPASGGAASYCIDRYEASLEREGVTWSPYLNPERRPVRAVSVRSVVPQAYVSQRQAAAACERAGKRLCDHREWMHACRGASDVTYGYGARREPGRCNENHRWHPILQMFRTANESLWGHVPMNDPQINQLPGTVALTGAHEGCTNTFGVYDMIGNLHEWTADPNGTFRGGYYMDTTMNGHGCNYVTTAHDTSYRDYSVGFRCCADATE